MPSWLVLVYLACWLLAAGGQAFAQAGPCQPLGRLVSLQGTIELRRQHDNSWSRLTRLHALVCNGDRYRTGAGSRAALLLAPETVLRIDERTHIELSATATDIVVKFGAQAGETPVSGAARQGRGYFITRFPRNLKFEAPFVYGSVDGTEFQVALAAESAEVTVFEGAVKTSSLLAGAQPLTVAGGQSASFSAERPAAPLSATVRPADAVQWALFYPPLPGARPQVSGESCGASSDPGPCDLARAEMALRGGRVDAAQALLDAIIARQPAAADALALSAVIAIVKNDQAAALALSRRAVAADPQSVAAWSAQSYVEQAHFDLDAALRSARQATALAPGSALSQARVAELEMILGNRLEAETAARLAVQAGPEDSRPHTMLGFIHLISLDNRQAMAEFDAAIARDSTDPLPRLGLGFIRIREGNLRAGREEIEIAVALDPFNALVRSYMGRVYFEENTSARETLASSQFDFARKLDPRDPTPHFYDALLQAATNRPLAALEQWQLSVEKNGNRAIYRAPSLIVQDEAARLASRAAIYRQVGAEEVGRLEAAHALGQDTHNPAAHRILSEAAETQPLSSAARESEYLQSLLTLTPGAPRVSPFRNRSGPFAALSAGASGLGPSVLSAAGLNEYSSLFVSNGADLSADLLYGGRNTRAQQSVVTGTWNLLSISAGAGHFETDGFGQVLGFAPEQRVNAQDVLVSLSPNPGLKLQVEWSHTSGQSIQAFFPFDPGPGTPVRFDDSGHTTRLGVIYAPDAFTTLTLSGIWQSVSGEQINLLFDVPVTLAARGAAAEAQMMHRQAGLDILVGSGGSSGRTEIDMAQIVDSPSSSWIYAYLIAHPARWNTQFQLGLSADTYRNSLVSENHVSPKLGLTFSPWQGASARGFVSRAVRRSVAGNQTLEPTQIAGFSQLYDDIPGSVAQQSGIGFDQRFTGDLRLGVSRTRRSIDTLIEVEHKRWNENRTKAYGYVPLRMGTVSLALNVELEWERLRRPEDANGPEAIVSLDGHYAPVSVTAYMGSIWSTQFKFTHISQSAQLLVPGSTPFDFSSNGWVMDWSLTGNLPRRYGRVTLGVSNWTDKHLNLVDTDAATPRVGRERFAYARAIVDF